MRRGRKRKLDLLLSLRSTLLASKRRTAGAAWNTKFICFPKFANGLFSQFWKISSSELRLALQFLGTESSPTSCLHKWVRNSKESRCPRGLRFQGRGLRLRGGRLPLYHEGISGGVVKAVVNSGSLSRENLWRWTTGAKSWRSQNKLYKRLSFSLVIFLILVSVVSPNLRWLEKILSAEPNKSWHPRMPRSHLLRRRPMFWLFGLRYKTICCF